MRRFETEIFLLRHEAEDPAAFRNTLAQREFDGIHFQPAGFDLGEIQNIVQQFEQRMRRKPRHLQVFALLRGQVGGQRQVRHADDAVHRRADFMAHVGQEFALQ